MLVDLGRNDVGRVATPGTCGSIDWPTSSATRTSCTWSRHVEGDCSDGLDAFDAFDALFPAGTLTGAPKVRAMELIDEFEPVFRGPYGGAVGYFSLSGNADFAITIRTLSLRGGVATVQAGGGVVADSQPRVRVRGVDQQGVGPAAGVGDRRSVVVGTSVLVVEGRRGLGFRVRGLSSFARRPLARDSAPVGPSRRVSCASSRVAATRQFAARHRRLDGASLVTAVSAVAEATPHGEFRDVGEGVVESLLADREVEQSNARDVEEHSPARESIEPARRGGVSSLAAATHLGRQFVRALPRRSSSDVFPAPDAPEHHRRYALMED